MPTKVHFKLVQLQVITKIYPTTSKVAENNEEFESRTLGFECLCKMLPTRISKPKQTKDSQEIIGFLKRHLSLG